MGTIRRYESLSLLSLGAAYTTLSRRNVRANLRFGEGNFKRRTLLDRRSKEKNWTISGNIRSTVSTGDIRDSDWLVGDSTRKLGEIR